jgi:type III restriction enzyme
LNELAQVERRRTDAAQLLSEHRRDRKSLGDPSQSHAELRSEIVDLLRERTGLLAEESDRLTTLSEGLLRASINRGRGLAAVEQKFKGFIQGSGVRSGKVDQLFTGLRSESDPLGTWEEVLIELEAILQLEEDVEHSSESTPVLSRLGFPLADQQRIRSRMTADGWLDLALTPIKDEPVFEYRTKEKEFIAFSAASAGQQATALLRMLLAQTGMPLIIDQPEEDLDSQVVQDVVARIWGAKKGRQLLFASHNANLVVNGDAELVVACDYRKQGDQSGGRIKFEGAIDMPEVREEITRVMEGGEKAFRLRKEKYGF